MSPCINTNMNKLVVLLGIVTALTASSSAYRQNCECAPSCLWIQDTDQFKVIDGDYNPNTLRMLNEQFPEKSHPADIVLSNEADPNLYFTQEGTITLKFYHEGAGYRNQLGYYLFDDNGAIIEQHVVFPDLSFYKYGCMETGDYTTIGPIPAGTNVGFWIRANGYNGGTNTYYSGMNFADLNPDGLRHVAVIYDTNTDELLIGFEDLYNLGDKDYNDAMFTAVVDPPSALNTNSIPKITGSRIEIVSDDAVVEPTFYVDRAGFRYATVDQHDVSDTYPGCAEAWHYLPTGYSVTKALQSSFAILTRRPWGTEYAVLADEWGYRPHTGQPAINVVPDTGASILDTNSEGAIGTNMCPARVIMSKPLPNFDVGPLLKMCGGGDTDYSPWAHYGSLAGISQSPSDGQGGCQSWCRTVSAAEAETDSMVAVVTQVHSDLSESFYKFGFSVIVNAKATGVSAPADVSSERDFSVYVDVEYTDGKTDHFYRPFPSGTYDWTERRVNVYAPAGNLKSAKVHGVFRRRSGSACFSKWSVRAPEPNIIQNPSFSDLDITASQVHGGRPTAWFPLDHSIDSDSFSVDNTHQYNDVNDVTYESDDNSVCLGHGCGTADSSGTWAVLQRVDMVAKNHQAPRAVRIGGYSKCEGVDQGSHREDYSVYADFEYEQADGSSHWVYAVSAPFDIGTHDWQHSGVVYPVLSEYGALKSIVIAAVFRNHNVGKAWFDRIYVDPMYELANAERLGSAYGDPHLQSFDGKWFDMQGVGEYVLVRDQSMPSTFDVQIRTVAAGNNRASIINSLAVSGGCVTVEIRANPAGLKKQPIVFINGGAAGVDFVEGQTITVNPFCSQEQGTTLTLSRVREIAQGAYKSHDTKVGQYELIWSETGHSVAVTVYESSHGVQFLQVGTQVPSTGLPMGLLGNNDGNPDNDFIDRNGNNVADAYEMAESWRVTEDESCFKYYAGESTATFTDTQFHINAAEALNSASDEEKAAAQEACSGLTGPMYNQCYTDVLATGDVTYASAMAATAADMGEGESALEEKEITSIASDESGDATTDLTIILTTVLTTFTAMSLCVAMAGFAGVVFGGFCMFRYLDTRRRQKKLGKHTAFSLGEIPSNLIDVEAGFTHNFKNAAYNIVRNQSMVSVEPVEAKSGSDDEGTTGYNQMANAPATPSGEYPEDANSRIAIDIANVNIAVPTAPARNRGAASTGHVDAITKIRTASSNSTPVENMRRHSIQPVEYRQDSENPSSVTPPPIAAPASGLPPLGRHRRNSSVGSLGSVDESSTSMRREQRRMSAQMMAPPTQE